MRSLNHVTLNTGHVRETIPSEVDKRIYFRLRRIFNDSFKPEGAEVMDGFRLKSVRDDIATIGTVYASDGAPILTTACSSRDDGSIWRMLHDTASEPLATNPAGPVPIPYIADRLEISAMLHVDALRWTGDFSRCFGWIVLAPNKIR